MSLNEKLNKKLDDALLLIEKGNKDKAIELLRNFCKKETKNSDIRYQIGVFLQQYKMPFKAEIFYRDSLKINNNQAIIYFNLGIIKQALNQINEAIELYLKAIEIAPDYARAYANLGYLYKQLKKIEDCKTACLTALQLEPENPQIQHMVAALGVISTPKEANQEYIKNLYDEYADNYDQHLSVTLKSKTPELIHNATISQYNKVNTHRHPTQQPRLLDLGCGTGICGSLFNDLTSHITGVDLSQKMIDEAKKKNIYTKLTVSDINKYLKTKTQNYEIIISSDVLIYLGDLSNIFYGIQKSLTNHGLFTFSIEEVENSPDDFILHDSGRYKHNHKYIKKLSETYKLTILSSEKNTLRQQNKQDVYGRIYVLEKNKLH